jgi:hypothetical protein
MAPEWSFDEFKARCPTMAATVSESTFVAFAASASMRLSRAALGVAISEAGCLLTAHLIESSGAAGKDALGAPLSASSAGGVSASFAIGKLSGGELSTTKWGAQLFSLLRLRGLQNCNRVP